MTQKTSSRRRGPLPVDDELGSVGPASRSFSNINNITNPGLKIHAENIIKGAGEALGDVPKERMRQNSPHIYDKLFGPNGPRNSSPNALSSVHRNLSPLNRNFSPIICPAVARGLDVGKENLSTDQDSTMGTIGFTPIRSSPPKPLKHKVLHSLGRLEKVSSLGSESDEYTPTFAPTPAAFKTSRLPNRFVFARPVSEPPMEKEDQSQDAPTTYSPRRDSDNDLGFGLPPPKRKPKPVETSEHETVNCTVNQNDREVISPAKPGGRSRSHDKSTNKRPLTKSRSPLKHNNKR
jgi:hypothetical protein